MNFQSLIALIIIKLSSKGQPFSPRRCNNSIDLKLIFLIQILDKSSGNQQFQNWHKVIDGGSGGQVFK